MNLPPCHLLCYHLLYLLLQIISKLQLHKTPVFFNAHRFCGSGLHYRDRLEATAIQFICTLGVWCWLGAGCLSSSPSGSLHVVSPQKVIRASSQWGGWLPTVSAPKRESKEEAVSFYRPSSVMFQYQDCAWPIIGAQGISLKWEKKKKHTYIFYKIYRIISLEKEVATHSSILAWRIPWTEEPHGLQSMGSQRAGHDWVTNTHTDVEELIVWNLWRKVSSSKCNGLHLTRRIREGFIKAYLSSVLKQRCDKRRKIMGKDGATQMGKAEYWGKFQEVNIDRKCHA